MNIIDVVLIYIAHKKLKKKKKRKKLLPILDHPALLGYIFHIYTIIISG